jgi:hypothetical protein
VKPNPGETKRGIDFAWTRESRATYALHVLVGHHGLLSLSPILLLSFAGSVLALRNHGPPDDAERTTTLRIIGGLTLLLTAVVVAFYLVKSDNYGGGTSGLRWLIWLTPLWLLAMIPAADCLATHRWGRGFALVLLAVSAFSVNYPVWNPWRHPWIYDLMVTLGWPPY